MTEQTVKCHICGRPYVFYMFYGGDQTACPKCRSEARGGKQWAQNDTGPNPFTDPYS